MSKLETTSFLLSMILLGAGAAGCGDDDPESMPDDTGTDGSGGFADEGSGGAGDGEDAPGDDSTGMNAGESGEPGEAPADHVDLYFLSRMTCMDPDPCPDFEPVIACAVEECALDDIYTNMSIGGMEIPIPDPGSSCFDYWDCMYQCGCDGGDATVQLQGAGTCSFEGPCDRDCAESCEAELADGPCKERLDEAWSCAQDAGCFTESCEAYDLAPPSTCDALASCCDGLDAAMQIQCEMALDGASGDEDSCAGVLLGYQSSGLC